MNARLIAFALAMTSGCCAAANPDPGGYVELDGHWYLAPPGTSQWFYNGYGFFMATANMGGCTRASGGPMPFGTPGLFVGQFSYPIYQIIDMEMRLIGPGAIAFRYTSAFGDVICDNEIASPIPDEIFASGFDPEVD